MVTIAVVGHVEHVTLGGVPSLPAAGEIIHLESPCVIPGGGGGVSYFQLLHSPARVLLFTAIGNDAAGGEVLARLLASGGEVHAVRRQAAHTRDVVMLTPDGERTIVVAGQPLHPERADALPYERLSTCDAVYFTAQDPELLVACRQARMLIVSARRGAALARSGVRADVVVGSALDAREVSRRADYPVPPDVVVMTEGAAGGFVESRDGIERFRAPPTPAVVRSSYGAGDSFAAALVYFTALGLGPIAACERAGHHGAAVLADYDTLRAQLPITS